MDGYSLDVHRTLPPTPANQDIPPTAVKEATYSSSGTAQYLPYPAQYHGYRPVYKPMESSILTITPEEIVALTNSPPEDEPQENNTAPPQSPSRKSKKTKGDSSPSPTSSEEAERKGSKRKRGDQSMAEVGSIMEDMRQAAPSAPVNPQRSLAEGEAAFLSLVMQAASSEPIDELSQDNEPAGQLAASLPGQLLESFIVRAHAMKSGPETPNEDTSNKKRKGSEDNNDLDVLQDYLKKKKDKRKDYGLDGLRRGRDGSADTTSKGEVSSDEDQQSQAFKKESAAESDPSDQPMTDVVQAPPPPPPKRRPGRPPKPKFIVPIEIEPYGPRGRRSPRLQDKRVNALVAETLGETEQQERRHEQQVQPEMPKPKRRGPGRPPKRRPNEELFSFNEESLEGEKAREQQRRELANGIAAQLRRQEYAALDPGKEVEAEADEWISGQEDNDEDDWHDDDDEDDEDESWIDWDGSSDAEAEVEVTPEEQAEEAALVDELAAAEEIRAVADAVRRELAELRRANAVSLSESQGVSSSSSTSSIEVEPEVKVEPWAPVKQQIPLTFRRLRPPWLNVYHEFKARGISIEEQRIEAEKEWKRFVADSADNRVWIKVPTTTTTWEAVVAFSQERKREKQEAEDRERLERREKRLKEVQEQLLQEAQQEEEEEDNMDEERETNGGADDVDEADDDEEADEESDDDDDDDDDDERGSYQRRRRRKKKKDMVAQLLDCFKEKDLEKVLVIDAAARKRKPPRKYGIDEWYHRRG